ncbi:MAG: C4-type zinc ribbon domain-containing protein [Bacteroidota bacterium]|nr:C4-type zinc ribbon domain-containing protein [Bacteroidota bacterium]
MATKKTKKVATPVDQRETFVSIQKNFADSDISVEEKLRILYELQKADVAIDKIISRRGELPEEVKALEEEIAVLKAKISKLNELNAGLNLSIAENKEKAVASEDAAEKYRAQLNQIQNSREYDSIEKEIENLDLEKQIANKFVGEAKMKIAENKAAIEEIEQKIDVRNEDLRIKKEELDNIAKTTAAEESTLKTKRDALAEKIDERTMSAYERIRASVHNHLAVVSVFNENACGGCFNTIIPQRLIDIASMKKLVICEHCGRIIVSPETDK